VASVFADGFSTCLLCDHECVPGRAPVVSSFDK
jgi:hypothetical protein